MLQMPLKILIVEDCRDRQKVLKNLFKDQAWVLVNTAQRAIRLIEVYDFDMIALDYDLDGEDKGDKVAGFIKQSRNAHTKVLVHSMNVQGVEQINNTSRAQRLYLFQGSYETIILLRNCDRK